MALPLLLRDTSHPIDSNGFIRVGLENLARLIHNAPAYPVAQTAEDFEHVPPLLPSSLDTPMSCALFEFVALAFIPKPAMCNVLKSTLIVVVAKRAAAACTAREQQLLAPKKCTIWVELKSAADLRCHPASREQRYVLILSR